MSWQMENGSGTEGIKGPSRPNYCHPDRLAETLDDIRKSRVCAYTSPDFCDCKFGLLENPSKDQGYLGEQNGCPEMRVVIEFLRKITPKEFEIVSDRKKRPPEEPDKEESFEEIIEDLTLGMAKQLRNSLRKADRKDERIR